MFILKNRISGLIKKERAKEKKDCEKKYQALLKTTILEMKKEHDSTVRLLKKESAALIKDKQREIDQLRGEIERKHADYQKLRLREKQIDDLSAEFQLILEDFGIKVQEAIQPYYRTRAKIEVLKRKSDRTNDKNSKIYRSLESRHEN